MATPKVFIVDDDASMRHSTGQLLEAAGFPFETFDSASAFLEYYRDQPGCLIVDLSMPGLNGMQMVQQLRKKGIDLPMLIVSGTGTIPLVVEGMKLGVIDFLEKPTNPEVLLTKVREGLAQDDAQRAESAAVSPIVAKLKSLSARETEILKMLIVGQSSKQIAWELNISLKTVENHRAKVMQKTGALNTADLTRMATLVKIA